MISKMYTCAFEPYQASRSGVSSPSSCRHLQRAVWHPKSGSIVHIDGAISRLAPKKCGLALVWRFEPGVGDWRVSC